ncbi:nucleotidyltransferase domain-containing protein [Cyanobium sp. Alchichica 3B3-8F6]|nr:nucleotidyltransferase domain-containing protein [Cyanobium sp. Alchichica 3B3-8F6]
MPVRSLTQSLLRWPEPRVVLEAVERWAAQQACSNPTLQKVGVYGSYGRGDAGVGSDLDLLLVDQAATGPQTLRYRQWPFEQLPLSCDALVLTTAELEQLLASSAGEDSAKAAMASALQRDCRWVWTRSTP